MALFNKLIGWNQFPLEKGTSGRIPELPLHFLYFTFFFYFILNTSFIKGLFPLIPPGFNPAPGVPDTTLIYVNSRSIGGKEAVVLP